MAHSEKTLLLAAPRGYCAGVDRAVVTVERALQAYGEPVYVRKQIVHNKHVVENLEERGAVFVDDLDQVPDGSLVIFSAHGVSPQVQQEAKRRGLRTIDATCPLVTKVHHEARRFAQDGTRILLIGHAGHEEVEGTTGEAPDHITLVQTPEDVDALSLDPDEPIAWLSQTTLSVDETSETVQRIRKVHPHLIDPPSDDICYATQNRQHAVKQMAPKCDLVIVVGSQNSSNTAVSSRSPWSPGPGRRIASTMPPRSIPRGCRMLPPSASLLGPRYPRSWCRASWNSWSPRAGHRQWRRPSSRNPCRSPYLPSCGSDG